MIVAHRLFCGELAITDPTGLDTPLLVDRVQRVLSDPPSSSRGQCEVVFTFAFPLNCGFVASETAAVNASTFGLCFRVAFAVVSPFPFEDLILIDLVELAISLPLVRNELWVGTANALAFSETCATDPLNPVESSIFLVPGMPVRAMRGGSPTFVVGGEVL